jgi:hypothetical protein
MKENWMYVLELMGYFGCLDKFKKLTLNCLDGSLLRILIELGERLFNHVVDQ